jgi:hypothetical protein
MALTCFLSATNDDWGCVQKQTTTEGAGQRAKPSCRDEPIMTIGAGFTRSLRSWINQSIPRVILSQAFYTMATSVHQFNSRPFCSGLWTSAAFVPIVELKATGLDAGKTKIRNVSVPVRSCWRQIWSESYTRKDIGRPGRYGPKNAARMSLLRSETRRGLQANHQSITSRAYVMKNRLVFK